MEEKKGMLNDPLAQKLLEFYGLDDDHSLKQVTRTCVNLIVSEYFDIICSQKFKVPPVDDIREWVVEEWNRRVDDQLAEAVEKEYPDLSEEELDEKVSMIEKLYQKEYEHRVDAATRAVFRELKSRVLSLQKDVIDLKKKYTS